MEVSQSISSTLKRASAFGIGKGGFRTCVFNPKGVGVPIERPTLFNFKARVKELNSTIDHISKKYPDSSLYLVGFSMGGCIITNFLSQTKHTKVKGIVTVSSPWDLYAAACEANKLKNFIYGYFMTKNLIKMVKFNKNAIDDWCRQNGVFIDYEQLYRCKNTFDFDKLFSLTSYLANIAIYISLF